MVTDEFKTLAFKYMRLADGCSDEAEAARLRLIAADYWDKGERAGAGSTQQQQQIQPKTDQQG